MRVWFAAGFFVSIVLAWIAAKIHAAFSAPIGGISIGVGLVLGAALGTLAVFTNVRPRRGIIVGAIVLSFVTAVAQHAWLYVEFRRQWHQARANSPQIAMFRSEEPWSPTEYFGRELSAGRAAAWCIDGALIIGTAVGMLYAMERKRSESDVTANAKKTATLRPPTSDP